MGGKHTPPYWGNDATKETVGLPAKKLLVLAGEQSEQVSEKAVKPARRIANTAAIFQSLEQADKKKSIAIILTAERRRFCHDKGKYPTMRSLGSPNPPGWAKSHRFRLVSALEIIEAKYLFDTSADAIEVVVHPESIVHSLVEFCDGAVIGQFSIPDMAIPIQYALTWPERKECIGRRLNLAEICQLSFYKPDYEKFPALRLAYEVASRGGTCGAVFNAANERSVEYFMSAKLKFGEIIELVEKVLTNHDWISKPCLEELLQADQWARDEVDKCIRNL